MFKLKPLAVLIPALLCAPAASWALDTGDAPASYGLATHEVVANAPFLGDLTPDNNTENNSTDADADDNDQAGYDDEDGVFGHPTIVQNAKAYDTNVFVSNPSAQAANVVAWVDFDGSGTFDADEASFATVPAGASNLKVKMLWPELIEAGLSTDYFGQTYIRVRVSSSAITANDATGALADGEVEDYSFQISPDRDRDEIPDAEDPDNDNDGIPDLVEGLNVDSDNDGQPDYLDYDSDGDTIPDYIEAGANPASPIDSDGDQQPDYLDLDSNNDGTPDSAGIANDLDGDGIPDVLEGSGDADGDGIINSEDIDADNDVIPDSIEAGDNPAQPVDTDKDGVPDFLDLDSDNDGVLDIQESNAGEISIVALDPGNDGRADSTFLFGTNGFVDDIETSTDSGIPFYAIPDTDADGVRDFRDTDADGDGTADVVESGGLDADADGIVDAFIDTDGDGIPNVYDVDQTGGADTDNDGIDDVADASFVSGVDADNDGVLDAFDLDDNGDGVIDDFVNSQQSGGELPDLDTDGIPDYRDVNSIGGPDNGTSTAGTSTAGSTTGGTTTSGTTAGTSTAGTTAGTTAGSTTGDNAGNTTSVGIVETGLDGRAGCSIGSKTRDPMAALFVLLSAMVLFARRRKTAKARRS